MCCSFYGGAGLRTCPFELEARTLAVVVTDPSPGEANQFDNFEFLRPRREGTETDFRARAGNLLERSRRDHGHFFQPDAYLFVEAGHAISVFERENYGLILV